MPTRLALYLLVAFVFVTAGLCQQQTVVVPNPVTANQPFTVTCEANSVPSVPSNVSLVNALKIFRNVSTNATDVEMAYYVSYNPPGLNYNLTRTSIPPGRRWTITFSGSTDAGGSPVGNRNTMKIVLVVSDTRLEDAGIYRCHVVYYLPGEISIKRADVFINVKAIVTRQRQPIIWQNPVRLGQPFTIYCDTTRMNLRPPGHNIISKLRISRNLGDGFVTVAESQCASPVHKAYTRSNIPCGRSWGVTYSGNNITLAFPGNNITANGVNWDKMRISVKVYDTQREDAGVYYCGVMYLANSKYQLIEYGSRVNLTVID